MTFPRIKHEMAPAKHPESPAGQRRERAVKCTFCHTYTWNHCGQCNAHCTSTQTPNGALRQRLLEVLEVADRAGVPLRHASVSGKMVTLQGGNGTEGDMSYDDAARIAEIVGGKQQFDLADEVCRMSSWRLVTADVVMLCEPTREEVTSIPDEVLA